MMGTEVEVLVSVCLLSEPEVSPIHLPGGPRECPKWDLFVLLLFIDELDVACRVSGVDKVSQIPHLPPLYQFEYIVNVT